MQIIGSHHKICAITFSTVGRWSVDFWHIDRFLDKYKWLANFYTRSVVFITCHVTSSNGNIFRVTGHLCREFGDGEFPAQMASNTENVSIWWRHKVQWRTALIFSLICVWINGWESIIHNRILTSKLTYRQIFNIRCTEYQTLIFLVSSCSGLRQNHWSQVLCREWSLSKLCFKCL